MKALQKKLQNGYWKARVGFQDFLSKERGEINIIAIVILIAIVIGTAISEEKGPRINAQKKTEKKTKNGDRLRSSLAIYGKRRISVDNSD